MMALQWYLRVWEVEDLNPSRKSDFAVSTHYQEETTFYIFYIMKIIYHPIFYRFYRYHTSTVLLWLQGTEKDAIPEPLQKVDTFQLLWAFHCPPISHQHLVELDCPNPRRIFDDFFPKLGLIAYISSHIPKNEIDTTHIHKLWTIMNNYEQHWSTFPVRTAWKLREAVRGKCVPWDQCFPVV